MTTSEPGAGCGVGEDEACAGCSAWSLVMVSAAESGRVPWRVQLSTSRLLELGSLGVRTVRRPPMVHNPCVEHSTVLGPAEQTPLFVPAIAEDHISMGSLALLLLTHTHTHTLSLDAMSACLPCHAIQIVLGIAFRTPRQHVATHWGCAVEPGLLYEAGPHTRE